jgi:hypothetical protein
MTKHKPYVVQNQYIRKDREMLMGENTLRGGHFGQENVFFLGTFYIFLGAISFLFHLAF